jgi:hypothetical protein
LWRFRTSRLTKRGATPAPPVRFFTAAECIGTAVDRYQFKRGESDKIWLELDKGFYFRGTGSRFIYVMFSQL